MQGNTESTHLSENQLESIGSSAFQKGDYEQAMQAYKQVIELNPDNYEAFLNICSVLFTMGNYEECLKECKRYLELCGSLRLEPKVNVFLLYNKSIIKLKKLLTQSEEAVIKRGLQIYPHHKLLEQSHKTVKEIQISQNEQEFMDRMFEKLLIHPKIRNYMTDESFLTKVEKMIRNPSLSATLIKLDPRLEDVSEALLMAEDDTEGDRDHK